MGQNMTARVVVEVFVDGPDEVADGVAEWYVRAIDCDDEEMSIDGVEDGYRTHEEAWGAGKRLAQERGWKFGGNF